jgi:hypothetical protein
MPDYVPTADDQLAVESQRGTRGESGVGIYWAVVPDYKNIQAMETTYLYLSGKTKQSMLKMVRSPTLSHRCRSTSTESGAVTDLLRVSRAHIICIFCRWGI